ncbi:MULTISPECIES: UvrD-helicase domain-containing protein [Halorussus]|uniref:UvrD-helicase domain-containing protein n=1 Tax=Halorussus TaxID=1070314 RepID=UPI00209E91D6|nr:UvrD-helicase domain-containing protein [Halorussus vallis]USZ74033.1 AAA family ATPase [Halorussus vallis]
MTDVALDEVDLVGPDVDESVKIEGPPGTGKTTTCAARVARLVEEHGVDLDDVVWVTYRRSLAEDTLERLSEWDVITEYEVENPRSGRTKWISTCHATANRVAGDSLKGTVATGSDLWDFYLTTYNVPYDGDTRSPGKAASDVLQWLVHNQKPLSQAYESPAYDSLSREWPNHPHLMEIREKWESYKTENKLYDYHQMLQAALETDELPGESTSPSVVVADEYHDVYPLMDDVLRKWLRNADIAVVAGDPRQVVNSHEGSSPRYFERINLPSVTLPRSYRVPVDHWDAATSVLERTHSSPSIEISGEGVISRHESATFEYDEDSDTWDVPVDDSRSPANLSRDADGSVLFLARTRMMAEGVAAALRHGGVVYTGQGGAGGWARNDKRRHLFNSLTKFSGIEVTGETSWTGDYDLSDPDVDITGEEAYELLKHSSAQHAGISGDELLKHAGRLKGMSSVTAETIASVVEPKWWGVYTHGPVAARDLVGVEDDDRVAIQRAGEHYDEPIKPGDIDVQVLTIHASKGYEADTVVVYDGVTERIKQGMQSSPATRANEDRTWYVALTRAKERLVIMDHAFDWATGYVPYMVGRIGGESA